MKRLGHDLRRVLVVDDTSQKLERNHGKATYVRPFEGDPVDDELLQLLRYLRTLAGAENVRRIEKRWSRSSGA